MSRKLRLTFVVTTMLGAVALASIASAEPPPVPHPLMWAKFKASVARKSLTANVDWRIIETIARAVAPPANFQNRPPMYAPVSYPPGSAPPLRALALALNHGGAWTVVEAATLEEASASALAKCNAQFGSCELSAESVSQLAFACLAVGRSAEDRRRLFVSRAGSQHEVNAGVVGSMADAGTSGRVEYAACNAASS